MVDNSAAAKASTLCPTGCTLLIRICIRLERLSPSTNNFFALRKDFPSVHACKHLRVASRRAWLWKMHRTVCLRVHLSTLNSVQLACNCFDGACACSRVRAPGNTPVICAPNWSRRRRHQEMFRMAWCGWCVLPNAARWLSSRRHARNLFVVCVSECSEHVYVAHSAYMLTVVWKRYCQHSLIET